MIFRFCSPAVGGCDAGSWEGVEGYACERGESGYEVAVMSLQSGGDWCGHGRYLVLPRGGRGQSLRRRPHLLCAWEDC